MERFVGTYVLVWSNVLEPIFECGAVCWDRIVSLERRFGTDSRVWIGVFGQIFYYRAVCQEIYFKCGAVSWFR